VRLLARWTGAGTLALLLMAAPAHAGKALVVDWQQALIYPLKDGRPVRAPIVTNNRETFTDKDIGTFRITEKVEDKRSNLYNTHGKPIRKGEKGASMRYWMRLSWTAQGFHHSALFTPSGSRHRSHGCYRLSLKEAQWLFTWAPVGTPVHVVRNVRESRFAYLLDASPKATVAHKPAPRPKPSAAGKRASAKPMVTIRPASRPSPNQAVVRIRPAEPAT
jgi:hypothetical protein